MRKSSPKFSSLLDQLHHPDLPSLLLLVQQSQPTTLPTLPQLQSLIFDSFLDQCQRFLSQQSKFHHFSTKIAHRATDIIHQIDKIQKYNKVAAKPEVESDIERILTKTELNHGREETLGRMLEHLVIPDEMVRRIVDQRGQVDTGFFEAVDMLEKQKLLIVTLETFGESKLVESIRKSRGSLVNVAITKVLKSLNKLPDTSDFDLLLKYKNLLLDTEQNKKKFEQAIMNNRKQLSKTYFAPIISQLNYTLKKPIQQYYSSIFSEVLNKFSDERYFLSHLFPQSKSRLLSELTSQFVLQVYFRLERCFFKAMQPLSLCKIKQQYLKYYKQLRTMLGTQQYKSVHIESSLIKLNQCIESVIKTESQKMIKNKYNIYSVAGYMGIADSLKIFQQCWNMDGKDNRWVQPFWRLAESRGMTEQNKSLVIFGVNIWEIYLKVFGGEEGIEFENVNVKGKAQETIRKGKDIFISMNKKQFTDKLMSNSPSIPSSQKQTLQILLKLCSSDIKKILHSQLSLIIHENIRSDLKLKLNEFVMEQYIKMIEIVKPMKNEELKKKCQELGINIKMMGRAADSAEVWGEEQMEKGLQ